MKNTYIIAGGGTGGHIYPGVAVARALQKLEPGCEIHFVGTADGLETKIIPREGFPLQLIPVGKLNHAGSVLGKLKTVLLLPYGFFKSVSLLNRLQPTAVLGVGGYASGPFVLAASLMGVPTAIWEANAHPGVTNRLLAKFVRKAYLVFDEAKALLKANHVAVSGLPVRSEIEQSFHTSATALQSDLAHEAKPFTLLVFGGSQGSRAINNAVVAAVEQGGDWLNGMRIIHQTGRWDYSHLKERYAKMSSDLSSKVEVHEFLFDMHNQYAQADLVLCRGGASTVAEIAACGKAAIIVPLPSAADNHQQKNAETLVRANAGRMLLQGELTTDNLIKEIQALRANSVARLEISQNVKKMFIPQAAQTMAKDLMEGLPL